MYNHNGQLFLIHNHLVICKLPYLAGQGQHLPQSAAEQHPHVPGLLQVEEQSTHPINVCG